MPEISVTFLGTTTRFDDENLQHVFQWIEESAKEFASRILDPVDQAITENKRWTGRIDTEVVEESFAQVRHYLSEQLRGLFAAGFAARYLPILSDLLNRYMVVTDARSGNTNLDPDGEMFTILVNSFFITSSLDTHALSYFKTFLRHSTPESARNIPIMHAECLLEEFGALMVSQAELLGPRGRIAATMADALWIYFLHLPPHRHNSTRGGPRALPLLPPLVHHRLTKLLIDLAHTPTFQSMDTDLQVPFTRLASVLNKLQHKGYRFLRRERKRVLGLTQFRAHSENACNVESCTAKGVTVCSKCQCVRYCSRGCQREDWGDHRRWCFKTNFLGMSATVPASGTSL